MLDYIKPLYAPIYEERRARLYKLRENIKADPAFLGAIKAYYADHVADFIDHWGFTMDPRNAGTATPVVMPFILYPKQREWISYIDRKWRSKEDGLTEKSRDIGISWLAMAWAASSCLLRRNFVVGFGSAKEDKVDLSGDPSCLFYKGRMFVQNLPREFRGEWDIRNKFNSAHMRLMFPETDSAMTGEAGDNIGRGGRTAVYFVDEAAHIERPKLIDASLSATTDCRVDMSSVNGMANSFAEKRHGGKVEVFTFNWRADPRRTDEWAAKKEASLDPVIWAAEYEINYSASVEGVIIPFLWVQAAVGLLEKLNLAPTGAQRATLDVADRGMDKNAFAFTHGQLLKGVQSWSGKDSDIYATTARAFMLCDELRLTGFDYDADGLGAGVRGDARVLNEKRVSPGTDGRPRARALQVHAFRGSASVMFPERVVPGTDRKNEDFFANLKAQSWWGLRFRFQESFKASRGLPYDPAGIISIARDIPELTRLMSELSQPVYKINLAGKILVDKQPEETMSPNLADAVMMAFAPRKPKLFISDDVLNATAR
jgi:phage terminase large subunit